MFFEFYKCGELHLEALLSWFVEFWSRRRAATFTVSDGAEPPKGHGKKGENVHFCNIRTTRKEYFSRR